MNNNELKTLTRRLLEFRDARDWQQFHSLKDLIISLNLESGELLELTQWKDAEALEKSMADPNAKQRLREECADVLTYLLLIAEKANFDLVQSAHEKIDHNEEKYPVARSKGNAKKYSQL